MALLERMLLVDDREISVGDLVMGYAGHMYSSIRDLVRSSKRIPDTDVLLRSAALLQTGSASQVGLTAAWLDVLEVLEAGGLSALERLEVLIEVLRGDFVAGMIPGTGVVAEAASQLTPDQVRPIVEALDAEPVRNNPMYAVVCALPLIRAGEPPPSAVADVRLLWVPPAVLRHILEVLEPDHREQVLLQVMRSKSSNAARVMLGSLSFVLDLIDSPGLVEALARLREVSADYPGIEELHELLDNGGPILDSDGLGPFVRASFDRWLEMQADAQRTAGVGAVAEYKASVRLPLPNAAELESAEAWSSASEERRKAIAMSVLDAIGKNQFKLVGIEPFDELPVAVFAHRRKKVKMSLVPGGVFERGLSDEEERKIRQQAEDAGITDTHEEFGQLVDHLPSMRPVQQVHVGPMLVGQGPDFELEPSDLDAWLDRGPWRLPTEAEWEYAARAGHKGRLTYRGDDLPLESWFLDTCDLGEKSANRFGLWGFGLKPEVCADLFRPTYEGAPVDGSPVCGTGPRVARGGAAEIYPWQGCGEWHLLLTAVRMSQEGWDYTLVARPVIGLNPLPRRPWVTPSLSSSPCE